MSTLDSPIVAAAAAGGATGSTAFGGTLAALADIYSCVRIKLDDEPPEDTTSGAVNASTVTIPVNDLSIWSVGSKMAWDDGTDERNRVIAVAGTSGAGNVTVAPRASWGSTAATHASGARILLEPRFSPGQITNAVAGAVEDLYPYVCSPLLTTLTPVTTTLLYALPDDFEELIALFQLDSNTSVDAHAYGRTTIPYEVVMVPTATSSSNFALRLSSFFDLTTTVQIAYRAKPTTSNIWTGRMADCVCWGAVARLMEAKTVPRTGPDLPEDPRTFPAGDISRSAAHARQNFERLRQLLNAEQRAKFPPARRYLG